MKLDVFCAWGDGPDVGMNLSLTEEERMYWNAGLIPIDLTADAALELAAKLIAAAQQAISMDKECAERDAYLAGALVRETDG